MGRQVPDLRRKLELLRRHGPHRDAAMLAAAMGVKVPTLNGWVTGSWKSAQESVPEKRMPALVDLFARSLPASISTDRVEALLLGPLAALEDAFRAENDVLLAAILETEARRDTGRLHRAPTLGLVEHDADDGDADHPSIKLHERFYLEFTTERAGFVLALQNVQQTWGIVKFADGSTSPKMAPGSVILPGIHDARIVHIRETSNPGRHRFVLFVSPGPYPAVIDQLAAAGKSLEWPMLKGLAAHYAAQPAHLREVHLLHVLVRDHDRR